MAFLLWQYATESARRFPSRPAVAYRAESLTYAELVDQSARLASILAADGIGPGMRVGLYMGKSVRSVVAMLGILRTGAAYVPVDPNAPARRAAYILGNCGVSGLVTTARKLGGLREFASDLDHVRTVLLAEDQPAAVTTDLGARVHPWTDLANADPTRVPAALAVETDPAYLLYTSGSTGNPKGVILSHRNAIAFVEWGAETFAVTHEDRLSNHAPLHFDLSVFDVYVALRCGACVRMVPEDIAPFPMELARWIDAEQISVWYSVPSALTRLLLHGQLERFGYGALRQILFAGEVFQTKYLRDIMGRLPHVAFANLYGPTETNVCTFYKVPQLSPDKADDIPIGVACANTEVFAVDDEGRRVEPGETGELLVRGPTVMLGYWGLPEKTTQVLVRNPLQSAYHDQVYRTGDYVRMTDEGEYLFAGRRDNMVKSRGYRIELGEIEQAIHQHDRVLEAVVMAKPDDEIGARLLAVVVLHPDCELSESELHAFCNSRLPKYMVPETFTFRGDFPRTSTGKTDRVALRKDLGLA